ncbi:Lrp/AsnC family transcriptional regulator [Cucumibacter marinus]|uniref:Lrp/AsnC family transcriptional regulator n=1 Tax=Cucumibacter marinus TaxID=1121252 RepID=UPI0003FCF785|nr:Lrp/AsnC ligand binding domain-containing protein [Cucumibacter marinus]
MTDIERLDRIDERILKELSADGRLSIAALARRVNLSKTPCQARVKRLEQAGYILGYRAIINPEKLDRAHIAFVEVKLTDTRAGALDAFNKAVMKMPEIEQCNMIAGSFDYLLRVRTRDIADYRAVLGEKISALPHVAHTSTYVSMENVKDVDHDAVGPDVL